MPDKAPSVRATLGVPARRVVAGATDPRFDAVEAELARILNRLASVEEFVARNEIELLALRQQAEEALAYLRVQHDIVRDLLEELRPVLETRRAAAPSPGGLPSA
jgi:hypothetical protein